MKMQKPHGKHNYLRTIRFLLRHMFSQQPMKLAKLSNVPVVSMATVRRSNVTLMRKLSWSHTKRIKNYGQTIADTIPIFKLLALKDLCRVLFSKKSTLHSTNWTNKCKMLVLMYVTIDWNKIQWTFYLISCFQSIKRRNEHRARYFA